MALSGTIQQSYAAGNVVLAIDWSATQDQAANTSTITATARLTLAGSKYIADRWNNIMRVDGVEEKFPHSAQTAATRTLYTMTRTVTHDANGDRSVALYCEFRMQMEMYGYSMGNITVSGTAVLDGIAKASTISAISSSVEVNGANAVSVAIARKVTGVWHKVKFRLDDAHQYTTGAVQASASYAIPMSWLSAIPNATSATCTATLYTYRDEACTQLAAGSADSRNFEITVPASVAPVGNTGWVSIATDGPGSWGEYVQGYSRAVATFDDSKVDVSGCYGASIVSHRIVCRGVSDRDEPFQTQILDTAGETQIACYVNDSRGRFFTQTINVNVRAYSAPTMTGIQAFRCNASGTEDSAGTYISVQATAVFSSVNGKNSATIKAAYKINGGSYTGETTLTSGQATVIGGGNIAATSSYTAKIWITDALGNSSSVEIAIPTKKVGLNIREGNTGAGIGKYGETDGWLETPFSIRSGGGMELGGGLRLGDAITTETDAARAQSMQNLTFLGVNPDFEDTTVNWGAKGPCYAWYNANGVSSVTDQPSQYGFLINIPYGPSGNYGEARQIWASQHTGGFYHRGGNASGWTSWKQMIDSAGGTIDGALSVAGDFTAKNGVLLPETEQGLTGKLSADYGGIVLESSNSDSANKRMLSVDNLTFQSDTRYAMRVIEIREGVYSAYYVPAQTNWIELTPADGVTTPGEHGNGALRYRAEGKHVYLAGSVNVAWDGTNNKLIATLPSGYRPSRGDAVHSFQVTGGNKIARIYVAPTGEIYLEWKRNLSDGSSATDDNWLEVNMDFWTD